MKEIPLTQGKVALVDDADYDWLNQWKWFAHKDNRGNFYAMRGSPKKNGKQHIIRMAREILELEYGDKRQADHIHHNTLDNQRDNIRIATPSQNSRNMKSRRNSSSKYKGVSWYKQYKKWVARIMINGGQKCLGYFAIEKEAARTYDRAAKKYFGEFAHLNFN